MACHCAGQGKIPGQSLWELVDTVKLGQGFLSILHFSLVSITPPISGVPRGVVWGVQTLPKILKF
jgi:hypothetical protein